MIEKTRGGDLRTHFKARGLTQHFRKSQKPFFGFVNFKTAHGPYKNAPEPYKSYYTDDSIRPANPILDRVYREFLDKEPDQIDGIDYERLCRLASDFPVITGEFEPTHEEWDIIKDWYDGSIRYMDAKIGMILQSLKKEDELDNTWIIITSDHGELFGEHGLQSHVFSLYEELLRIPLIIHPPNNTNKKVSGMCSWIDLYPTICEIVGIDYPDRRHAKSLLPIGSDPGHHHLYAEVGRKDNPKIKENHPDFETIRENGPLQSIRDESWKLIRYPSNDVDLFNRVEDPVEQNECSNENPEVVERLLKKMNSELEHMDSFSYHQADEILSPEVENQLEFLGYR
jgi:arylsulfatase A-like enzyme